MKLPKPAERRALLIQRRNEKMARSAHAYVRGNTVQFYEWLHSQRGRRLPKGPSVWICGDCHIGNLGPTGDKHGRIAMHIRDLDQTVIGNPVHDLVRLALSLAMAARSSDLPGVTTARMLEEMMRGYEFAFSDEAEDTPERPRQVKAGLRDAVQRTWKKNLAQERIEDAKPTIPLGRHFWPLAREEKKPQSNTCAKRPPCMSWLLRLNRDPTRRRSKCSTRRIGSRAVARSACCAMPCCWRSGAIATRIFA